MSITIISSFAEDRFMDTGRVAEGGPAFFITQFCQKNMIPYNLITGTKGIVAIEQKNDQEKGYITRAGKIILPQKKGMSCVLISTLLDEFPLQPCGVWCCVDIQGYVRDKDNTGFKKVYDNPALEQCAVVKGTAEELSYISTDRLKKIPLVLKTEGSRGFSIITRTKEYVFWSKPIMTQDTIGAGDTLFAAFCTKYYANKNIVESAQYAQQSVEAFLGTKIRPLLQIGVMGSAADLAYPRELRIFAEQVGELLAKKGCITVYGAEKDSDSLSTAAARGAKKSGGKTVGVTYGRGKEIYDKKSADIIIVTGSDRGGGREFVLVNSCDAIIAISGGSGTLTELAIGYQSNIPLICVTGVDGWSGKIAGTFIDERKRVQCLKAETPEEAVRLAIVEANKKINSGIQQTI